MGNYGDAFGIALAEQLRAERSAAQLSLRELAERAGMNQQTVMRYLNGVRDVPMSALADIAHGLNMSVQTIVERAEQRIAVTNVPGSVDDLEMAPPRSQSEYDIAADKRDKTDLDEPVPGEDPEDF